MVAQGMEQHLWQNHVLFKDCLVHVKRVSRIADNGCGIPPENLDRVFDPGFAAKGAGVGTGLGLPTCYQIVRAHQGRIEVASRPGEGSTFTVTL